MKTGEREEGVPAVEIPPADVSPADSLVSLCRGTPGLRLPADRQPALVYLARLGPRSRRTIGADLLALGRLLGSPSQDLTAVPWHALRYQHTQALRARLQEQISPRTGKPLAPATINRMLTALRGVLAEAWRLGLMDAESYHRAVDLKSVAGVTLPRGRALEASELNALFAACAADQGAAGGRDGALLATLYAAGLRRSEIVALDHTDLDAGTGTLTVRHGKGQRARLVYLQGGAAQAMARWLELRGPAEGPLFARIRAGGRLTGDRLTAQAILDILRRRCMQAGVPPCSPHDLRRSMISDLLDAGADISTVQRLAGHAQVTTTQRYDRRGEAAKRRAAGMLHVPYTG